MKQKHNLLHTHNIVGKNAMQLEVKTWRQRDARMLCSVIKLMSKIGTFLPRLPSVYSMRNSLHRARSTLLRHFCTSSLAFSTSLSL